MNYELSNQFHKEQKKFRSQKSVDNDDLTFYLLIKSKQRFSVWCPYFWIYHRQCWININGNVKKKPLKEGVFCQQYYHTYNFSFSYNVRKGTSTYALHSKNTKIYFKIDKSCSDSQYKMHIFLLVSILEFPPRFPGVIKCFRAMRFYNRNPVQNIRNNQPILCLKFKKMFS